MTTTTKATFPKFPTYKDLGKKWFAFSKMDSLTADVLAKLSEL